MSDAAKRTSTIARPPRQSSERVQTKDLPTDTRGVPLRTALGIIALCTAATITIGVLSGSLNWLFFLGLIAATIGPTMAVNVRGLFIVVMSIPLVYLVTVGAGGWFVGRAQTGAPPARSLTALLSAVYPVIEFFPILLTIFLGAIVLGVMRLRISHRYMAAVTAPPRRTPRTRAPREASRTDTSANSSADSSAEKTLDKASAKTASRSAAASRDAGARSASTRSASARDSKVRDAGGRTATTRDGDSRSSTSRAVTRSRATSDTATESPRRRSTTRHISPSDAPTVVTSRVKEEDLDKTTQRADESQRAEKSRRADGSQRADKSRRAEQPARPGERLRKERGTTTEALPATERATRRSRPTSTDRQATGSAATDRPRRRRRSMENADSKTVSVQELLAREMKRKKRQ